MSDRSRDEALRDKLDRKLSRPGFLRFLLAVLLGSTIPSLPAPTSAADACRPQPGDTPADVASVSETLELRLTDGHVLRLAGLDAPRATAADPTLPAKARAALEAWVSGGAVAFRSLAAEPDRWNRTPALLFHPAPADPSRPIDPALAAPSAADALLQGGWARARPERSVHACFADFLAVENAARAAHRGLWADPRYAVLDPDDAEAVAGQTGDMAIVEGPLRVHDSHGTLYLTLGRDRWGLTAVLPRRTAERFAKAGLMISDYVGTAVRLRGDLDDRFGPRLTLDDPDGFESVEPGTERGARANPATTVSAKHWTSRAPGR